MNVVKKFTRASRATIEPDRPVSADRLVPRSGDGRRYSSGNRSRTRSGDRSLNTQALQGFVAYSAKELHLLNILVVSPLGGGRILNESDELQNRSGLVCFKPVLIAIE